MAVIQSTDESIKDILHLYYGVFLFLVFPIDNVYA